MPHDQKVLAGAWLRQWRCKAAVQEGTLALITLFARDTLILFCFFSGEGMAAQKDSFQAEGCTTRGYAHLMIWVAEVFAENGVFAKAIFEKQGEKPTTATTCSPTRLAHAARPLCRLENAGTSGQSAANRPADAGRGLRAERARMSWPTPSLAPLCPAPTIPFFCRTERRNELQSKG